MRSGTGEAKRGHLLFEDVSKSHYHGKEVKREVHPALQAEAELIVDAFAPFHAFWWDHPLLGTEVGTLPDEDRILWYGGVPLYEKELVVRNL